MFEFSKKRSYQAILLELTGRLQESAPSRIQLLVGPRQVGKTTLLLELSSLWAGRAVYASAPLPPQPETEPDRWGRWVENACLARAVNAGYTVTYWREEPWEVDAILTGNGGNWLIEVKTGAYQAEDLRGLAHATGKFPHFIPLVLCDPGSEHTAQSAGFEAMSWAEFLL